MTNETEEERAIRTQALWDLIDSRYARLGSRLYNILQRNLPREPGPYFYQRAGRWFDDWTAARFIQSLATPSGGAFNLMRNLGTKGIGELQDIFLEESASNETFIEDGMVV